MYRTFVEDYGVRPVFPVATQDGEANYGAWIDTLGLDSIVFVPLAGALGGNITGTVYSSATNDGSGTTVVTYDGTNNVAEAFVNGTDEDRVGLLTVRRSYLATTERYVTLRVTAANAGDMFGCLAILCRDLDAPIPNGTAEGVAFNVGYTGH